MVCIIKRSSTDIVFQHNEHACDTVFKIPLPASLFTSGSDIYKTRCQFTHYAHDLIATLSQFLVVFGRNVSIHVGQVDNTVTLECKLDPPASHKMDVFYTWTGRQTGINATGSVLNITENDEFVCNVTIVYKSCSPHRLFSYSMAEMITVTIPTTTTTPTTTQERTSESTTTEFLTEETQPQLKPDGSTQPQGESKDWTWLYILLAVLGFLGLVGIVVGLVVSKKRAAAARARAK